MQTTGVGKILTVLALSLPGVGVGAAWATEVIHIKTPAIKLYEQRLRRELPLHQQAGCRDIPALAGEGRPAKGHAPGRGRRTAGLGQDIRDQDGHPVSSKVTATPGARRSRPHRGVTRAIKEPSR